MPQTIMPLTVLAQDEIEIQQAIRNFAEGDIKPLVGEMDRKAQLDPALVKKFFEMGIMGVEVPENYGGLGASFMTFCLVVEELSRIDGSAGVFVDVQNSLVATAFLNWGNDTIKERYLPKLVSEWVGAYALSESSSGSDAFSLQLKAEDKGDKWILNGSKLWITNASEANLFLVFANVDPSKGYKGITAFLVERDFPGFEVGKKEEKLGIRASSTCELRFKNCEVPKDNVLGDIGKGYKVAIETLNEGRIGISAQMLGISQGAYEATLSYIKEREQFGKSISSFQAVQFQLAEMRTMLETLRLCVYNAARLKNTGKSFVQEAAIAKLYSSRTAEKITSMAVNLFGGNGFTSEYPVEKFYRDAKIGQIYEGTSNMQLQTIAKLEL